MPLIKEEAVCEICGEPMPEGEKMFKFHGYSGPCPKPPIPKEEERGIGGKDVFLINCVGTSDSFDQVSVMFTPSGVKFVIEEEDASFTISPEAFNYLAAWLKSWGYV